MTLGRSCRVSAVLAAALAMVAGCSFGGGDPDVDPQSKNPWWQAGVKPPPQISHEVQAEGTVVTVRVETRSPQATTEPHRSRFTRRLMKVVWRSQPTRVDVVHLTVDGGSELGATWRRPQFERSFGPRPDGLDAGGSAQPPARGTGPYRSPRVQRLDEAATLISDLLARTAREHFELPTAQPEIRDTQECYEGFLGDKPAGKSQRSFALDLELPGDVEAESRLPGLAAYWAGLGLAVDLTRLDWGLSDMTGSVSGVGGISVLTFPNESPKAQRLVRFSANTGCYKP
jgi:hypothetical protein